MLNIFRNRNKILGMNARNLDYVRPYNRKKAKQLADEKIRSKRMLKKGGLPVPGLVAKIRTLEELENFDWNILPSSFALKPNRGFGGEGIVVVFGRKKGRPDAWVKSDGSVVTIEDLKNHIRNIIDGSFSLSNTPDIAFFEERLTLLKLFKPYSFKGIPDIRVIVFNKVPVMAMLRLPTKESGGKANLHQGAIGVGIDLASGVTTTAITGIGNFVEYAPGTRLLLSGIRIPYWKDILKMAIQAQMTSGLGYLGADVAIDRERGPVFLELNARPGLSIQVANQAGLKERLEKVKNLKIKSLERGMRLGMDLFGGEIEEEVEDISGRKVIGTVEKVKLIGKDEKEIELEAKIDTGAWSTSIDYEVAKALGYEEVFNKFKEIDLSEYEISADNEKNIKEEIIKKHKNKIEGLEDVAVVFSSSGSSIRPVVKVELILDDARIIARVNIVDRSDLKYPIIVGRRNLGRFLIDVNK